MLIVVSIITVGLLIFCILVRKSREHFNKNFPDLLWTAFFAFVATFAGVFLAIHLESQMAHKFEANTFKRSFAAIYEETMNNLSKIDALKGQAIFLPLHLDTTIENAAITNPLLYKYTGQEYWAAIEGCTGTVEMANNAQDLIYERFKNKSIEKGDRDYLNGALDNAQYYLSILQMQTQLYMDIYEVKQPGYFKEVMDFLNTNADRKSLLIKIQSKLKEYQNMDQKQRQELQSAYRKALSE